MPDVIFIDDDENSDWLHNPPTEFTILLDGDEVAKADLKARTIETEDAELEEYFYLLMDEGIEGELVTDYDGVALKQALEAKGYEVRAN